MQDSHQQIYINLNQIWIVKKAFLYQSKKRPVHLQGDILCKREPGSIRKERKELPAQSIFHLNLVVLMISQNCPMPATVRPEEENNWEKRGKLNSLPYIQ